jgi:hypothetical protein
VILGASIASLAFSAGGYLLLGAGSSPLLSEALALVVVVSAFLTICSAEARLSGQ